MKIKHVVWLWLIIFAFLCWEYHFLGFRENLSVLRKLQLHHLIASTIILTKKAGGSLSLALGWLGLGLMVIMNFYSLRKRTKIFNYGKLSSWLNFHIFCGIVGPTFILFHCDFKIRGLAGISFWSMVIALTSGLIGRYFYVQILQTKKDSEAAATRYLSRISGLLERRNITYVPEEAEKYSKRALVWAGIPSHRGSVGLLEALVSSIQGDFRIYFSAPEIAPEWPEKARGILKEYAVSKRRSHLLVPFQHLMGYWHAFHFPFAIFMYISAFIHVVVALMFRV